MDWKKIITGFGYFRCWIIILFVSNKALTYINVHKDQETCGDIWAFYQYQFFVGQGFVCSSFNGVLSIILEVLEQLCIKPGCDGSWIIVHILIYLLSTSSGFSQREVMSFKTEWMYEDRFQKSLNLLYLLYCCSAS